MARYEVKPTRQFRRDLKLAKKRGLMLSDLFDVVEKLSNDKPLDEHCRDMIFTATIRAIVNATSTPTGCWCMRKTPKYAFCLFTAQAHIPTFSVMARKDSQLTLT